MFNLPTPKLGDITAITITSPNLDQSLSYYEKLGFAQVMRADFPFPWIQVTDGALLIMLRQSETPYIALTYYAKDIAASVQTVEAAGIPFTEIPAATDMVKKYVFQSPDGLNISLVNIMDGFQRPPGPTMLTMPQEDYFNPEKYVNKTCGLYGEFAQPVKNLEQSIAFWESIGFISLSKTPGAQPWAILSDGLSVVGLHQTTEFDYPVITYFAADMKAKIEALKQNGLDNFTEHSPGNIILTTPEQQKINLFNWGA
jgi:catechol 2,3-dioxygenase-like lactoylglutathione lyase family enzyme/predicted enzyme related to lactoylglutathione lyase